MSFDFEKLDVYQEALKFVEEIYSMTKAFPREELYGVTSQLRRAATSMPINIAEGAGRYHKGNFVQFLLNSRGSLYECSALLQISLNQNYLSKELHGTLSKHLEQIARMLNGLIRSMREET